MVSAKFISNLVYEMEWLEIPLRRQETDEIGRYVAAALNKKYKEVGE